MTDDDSAEPAPTDAEREELERAASLVASAAHFELSSAALARGRAELDQLLERRQHKAQRIRWRVAWPVPAGLAGALVIWLLVRPEASPLRPPAPELATAQSYFLTAELTGAPAGRKDLDRATRRYRKDLLASLEGKR